MPFFIISVIIECVQNDLFKAEGDTESSCELRTLIMADVDDVFVCKWGLYFCNEV